MFWKTSLYFMWMKEVVCPAATTRGVMEVTATQHNDLLAAGQGGDILSALATTVSVCWSGWVRPATRGFTALIFIDFYGKVYSWIGPPVDAHNKIIYRRTRRVTTIPRPPWESTRRGESKSALTIFVKFIFDLLFFETSEYRVPTKIVKADLDSPRRIL